MGEGVSRSGPRSFLLYETMCHIWKRLPATVTRFYSTIHRENTQVATVTSSVAPRLLYPIQVNGRLPACLAWKEIGVVIPGYHQQRRAPCCAPDVMVPWLPIT
jgi:hypothetical protein